MIERVAKVSFLLHLLFLTATLFSISLSSGADTLTPGQPLADDHDGGTLLSAGRSFELGFFSPAAPNNNNRYVGIWYRKDRTVVWVANRQRPITGRSGRLSINSDGTLALTDDNSTIIWSSSSPLRPLARANPVARLLDNGNFVVVEGGSRSSDSFAWQSFDFPSDTLLPGMKLGWNLTTGFSSNLTAWTSASDPTPNSYAAGIDVHGDPQFMVWSGTQPHWRGGPWNGHWFSGIPVMKNNNLCYVHFVVDPGHQVTYSFSMVDPSAMSMLVMNQSGILQRVVWMEDRHIWRPMWSAPNDFCDGVSPCGPSGACYPNLWPVCRCLPGFNPKRPSDWWDLKDGSDGCVRKTALDCRNRTDGFVTLSNAKLPDTSRSVVERNMSMEQCRDVCLRNCSCTAHASASVNPDGSDSTGCIIWTTELTDIIVYGNGLGQDLYVRLAAADLSLELNQNYSHHRSIHVVVITVVLIALAIFILACVACCVWSKRKKTSRRYIDYIEEEANGKKLDLPLYDLGTIRDATANFSIDNKLGQGGFGPVYKGKLEEGQEIAVKRLSNTSTQGVDEFKNEVMLIAKLQHRNLVRLLGCCIQGGERMLIYEYMPNGSLDVSLFDEVKGALLDWPTRYNIIIGIARGLLYLHQDSRFKIIHRDMKASNVLLDENMNPKISDFGMARIFGGDESEVNTRRIVGTYGYMSPEYVMDGIFSVKSDVFSFGVLMLEIICGKKNRGSYHSANQLNLVGYIWNLWKEDKHLEIVKELISHSFPIDEVLRCIKIGLLCVQERPGDRPTMPTVLMMLGSDSAASLSEPKPPGFFNTRGPSESDSSKSEQNSLSMNKNASITVLEGR